MIFVPLPFVVSLLLAIMLVLLIRNSDPATRNPWFLALIALCAVQSALAGLRWGYGVEAVRYVMPVLAACLPALTWASYRGLIGQDGGRRWSLHLLPPILIAVMLPVRPGLIDGALIVLFLAYAAALLILGRRGPDGLERARLDRVALAHRALVIAAGALFLSALLDLAVALDISRASGRNAAPIVSTANVLGLLLIGLMAAVAAPARADGRPPRPRRDRRWTATARFWPGSTRCWRIKGCFRTTPSRCPGCRGAQGSRRARSRPRSTG